MPRDHRNGDKSPFQLAKESGVFERPECLTLAELESYFRAQPELVDEWTLYSQNKRSSPSWHLSEEGDVWVLRFQLSEDGQRFADIFSACAQYVKCEVKDFATSPTRYPSRGRKNTQPRS